MIVVNLRTHHFSESVLVDDNDDDDNDGNGSGLSGLVLDTTGVVRRVFKGNRNRIVSAAVDLAPGDPELPKNLKFELIFNQVE